MDIHKSLIMDLGRLKRWHSVNNPFKRQEHEFARVAAEVLTNAALSCAKQNGKNPAGIKHKSHITEPTHHLLTRHTGDGGDVQGKKKIMKQDNEEH